MSSSSAYFKINQINKLNLININSHFYLNSDISGSVIFADLSSNNILITLPKPEAGLYYKLIIGNVSTSNYILKVQSTTDDSTLTPAADTTNKINFVGGYTLPTDYTVTPKVINSANSNLNFTNIFKAFQENSLQLGLVDANGTGVTTVTSASGTAYVNNTVGDFIEFITDGNNWFGTGNNKNKSFFSANLSASTSVIRQPTGQEELNKF